MRQTEALRGQLLGKLVALDGVAFMLSRDAAEDAGKPTAPAGDFCMPD